MLNLLSERQKTGFSTNNGNLYAYAGNNPIKYTNPDGRIPFLVVTAAGGALVGAAYGAYKSYSETGSVNWTEVGKDALIGGAIGLGAGAAVSLATTSLVGAATATASSYEISAAVTTFISTNQTVGNICADLGRKLDYMFGKAQGNKHNIDRSQSMQRSLENIGLGDNENSRAYISDHLNKVLNDPKTIIEIQESGNTVRESLLKGPDGVVKVKSIWEDAKLITVEIFGGAKNGTSIVN